MRQRSHDGVRELDTTIAADRVDGPHRRPPGGAPPSARRAPDGRRPGQHLGQARRMLEKYRVQLWAQQLGTAQTVSDARIRRMLRP
ncbi:DUF3418 domain-containing protein [Micromonospora sp. NPDC094482]|uniref:DUF3418 domain-containing protein n=1 Tax=unclassified Micromonospora TaxID=2617518 RepID=UPI00332E718F